MAHKVCYIDVETTGLDAVKQDVIQIAGIIEVDGVEQDRFEFKCQPYAWDAIQQKALDVHGYSELDLRGFESPLHIHAAVCELLGRYVNRFDKKDKFIFAGYNSPFDYRFVKEWFGKAGDKFFNSYFYGAFGYHAKLIDVYPNFMDYARAAGLSLENNKLVTAAAHFNIPLQAHDAMADIHATREIDKILQSIWQLGIDRYQEVQKDA